MVHLITQLISMNLLKSLLLLFVLGAFSFLGPAQAQVAKKDGTATGTFPKPGNGLRTGAPDRRKGTHLCMVILLSQKLSGSNSPVR
jgi:hypothetical protein